VSRTTRSAPGGTIERDPWNDRQLRSLLFAPGNHPRKLAKVGQFGSDAIVLDLEDAVAETEKTAARATVRAALPSYEKVPTVIVRVNALQTDRLVEDVRAVVCSSLDGIMVPKVEDPATLAIVDDLITELEGELRLPAGKIRILPLIETAKGLVRCQEIAFLAPRRVPTLIFGLGDFSVEMGFDLTSDATELLYARSHVAVVARAAGMRAAIDGPYLDLQNIDGLVDDTRRSRQLGLEGRVVIYPPHVEHVQRAYSYLAPDELAKARRVVDAFEEAERDGSASIQVDGRFVDYPIYRRAQRKLARYDTIVQSKQ
jgi:citrate lyase subunit beta/citryl-CoA lyase